MKLGIIFGGSSSEHFVSVVSATSIITNLNKDKYEIYPIYLDNENNWYQVKDKIDSIYSLGDLPKQLKKIKNPFKYLKKLDIVFPCMHGSFGEDGKIQGLLEMFNIPYVGCKTLASAISYDKVYTKRLLKLAGINVTPDLVLKQKDNDYFLVNEDFSEEKITIKKLEELIGYKLNYPVFIKPAREGSSVGVIKVDNKNDLSKSLKESFLYDDKVLIERCIIGRELECAILNGKALEVGEVKSAENFYSYSSKYENKESFTIIPAKINTKLRKKIMGISEHAFKVINGKSLARIDFFYDENNDELYLNEINTMPGFTTISMYPKLAIASGITYSKLLDILIESAYKNFTSEVL